MAPHPRAVKARPILKVMASGRTWSILDPSPADVDWRDIAAHLAKLCRFDGACHSFYSVAQHSVLVAEQMPPSLRLYGLLHDAHEAVIGDIVHPVKDAISALGARHVLATLADLQDTAIHAAAGLAWPPPDDVARAIRDADTRAFVTEWRDLMPDGPLTPSAPCRPMGTRIRPWPWAQAEERYLAALSIHLPTLRRPG